MKSQDNNGLSRQDVHRVIPKSQYEPKHCISKIEYFVRTTYNRTIKYQTSENAQSCWLVANIGLII